MRAFTEAAH